MMEGAARHSRATLYQDPYRLPVFANLRPHLWIRVFVSRYAAVTLAEKCCACVVDVYLQGTPALVFFVFKFVFFCQLAASGSWLRPPDANMFVTECQGRLIRWTI